jgi:hypothetical protein
MTMKLSRTPSRGSTVLHCKIPDEYVALQNGPAMPELCADSSEGVTARRAPPRHGSRVNDVAPKVASDSRLDDDWHRHRFADEDYVASFVQ